jgi:hypothetical protein
LSDAWLRLQVLYQRREYESTGKSCSIAYHKGIQKVEVKASPVQARRFMLPDFKTVGT